MAREKTAIATGEKEKVSKSKSITEKTKAKSAKRKKSDEPLGDSGLIVIDDDLEWNREMEIEERRAYLEEARSQEAFD
ncbi:MAG: hypothetical protein OER82_09365 [Nitrosopumilus sp.]|nr:hypothetical protein [Nitrosopumilus sp.]